jgi:hypothetical protein
MTASQSGVCQVPSGRPFDLIVETTQHGKDSASTESARQFAKRLAFAEILPLDRRHCQKNDTER